MTRTHEHRVVVEKTYMDLHPAEDYTFTSIRVVEFEDDKVVWYDEDPVTIRLAGSEDYLRDTLKEYLEALDKPRIYITTERKVG